MKGDFGPRQLEAINRQIAMGERAIHAQRRVLAALRRLGKPTEQAQRLLAGSALVQRHFLQNRDAMLATIKRREAQARRAAQRRQQRCA